MNMGEMEQIVFGIISSVGMAKSSYVEAMRAASAGKFEEAEAKMKEGDEYYAKGHDIHVDLVQKEAAGEYLSPGLLLIHAEDQMMSAELVRLMAEENIKLNKRIQELEK